jgi:argininosuccinate lyase
VKADKKAWGGRFKGATHPLVEAYTQSLREDVHLAKWDIIGSIAHARMLGACRLVTRTEERALMAGLKRLYREAQAEKLVLDPALEDIHMNVEALLSKRIGRAAEKLHTARSRNDQVALDTRLLAREGLVELGEELIELQEALTGLAQKFDGVPMIGRTHFQPAQAVLFSHHLLAYREKFSRDGHRVESALERADASPLGAGALAGTTLKTDPKMTARLLGFAMPAHNSIDAVSDRDYIADAAYASTMVLVHLSQLSEEIVLWSSEALGYIVLPDAFSTGSSIMPQKRNPDVAELTRGRAALAIGDLAGLLAILKGLPMAYNRDLQEDKSALLRTMSLATRACEVFAEMLPALKFRTERLAAGFHEGFAGATDLAEFLVQKGIPFREAHGIVGRLVRDLSDSGRTLADLAPTELLAYSARFDKRALLTLSAHASAGARGSHGGSSRESVKRQLARAERDAEGQRRALSKYAAKVKTARGLAAPSRR